MILYEVTVEADAGIAEGFAAWLDGHVAAMIALPGIDGATCHELLDPAPADGARSWVVHYRMADRQALADYLERHAARMRQDGIDRFGTAFRARRRVLAPRAAGRAADRGVGS